MYNTKFKEDNDQSGFSVYSTIKLEDQFNLFGRYDNLGPKDDWSSADGQRILVGIQYAPIKQLKIAPISLLGTQEMVNRSFVYLNIEFKL